MKDFAKRKCEFCGARFDPADRTSNPANAARMRFCSPVCKGAAWREANREKVREINRRTSAAWYAGLDPEEKSARIAQIDATRKKPKTP